MDWKLALSTFAAVFLAELGDKTQLATFAMAAGASSRWAVLIGAATALVLTSVIAVVLGAAVGQMIPAHWLRRGAGVVFIVLGVIYVIR